MTDFFIATILIFAALMGWIWVQQLARHFAERYPQFGPAREEGSGCGSSCMCTDGTCPNKKAAISAPSTDKASVGNTSNSTDLIDGDNQIYIE